MPGLLPRLRLGSQGKAPTLRGPASPGVQGEATIQGQGKWDSTSPGSSRGEEPLGTGVIQKARPVGLSVAATSHLLMMESHQVSLIPAHAHTVPQPLEWVDPHRGAAPGRWPWQDSGGAAVEDGGRCRMGGSAQHRAEFISSSQAPAVPDLGPPQAPDRGSPDPGVLFPRCCGTGHRHTWLGGCPVLTLAGDCTGPSV